MAGKVWKINSNVNQKQRRRKKKQQKKEKDKKEREQKKPSFTLNQISVIGWLVLLEKESFNWR